jgi:hypothetical protein
MWLTIQSLWGNIWSIVSGVVQWLGKSELVKDIFWAIGKLGEFVMVTISKIGDTIAWIWENIIKPIIEAIDWAYSAVKGLLGGQKNEVTVTAETKLVPPVPTPTMPDAGKTTPMAPNLPTAPSAVAASGAGGGGKNMASDAVSGGQRSINIVVQKVIETLQVHVADTREAADRIRQEVNNGIRLTLNQIAATE